MNINFTFKYIPEIELNKSIEISKLSFTPEETTAKKSTSKSKTTKKTASAKTSPAPTKTDGGKVSKLKAWVKNAVNCCIE